MKKLLLAVAFLLAPLIAVAGSNIVRGNFIYLLGVQINWTPSQVGAATTADQSLTVPGVKAGDVILAQKPTITSGLSVGNVRVSAADTVLITFDNPTAGALTPPQETWTFLIFRPEDTTLPSRVSQ